MRKLTDQEREDLLVTALEGGSTYWYLLDDISKIQDKFQRGTTSTAEAIFKALKEGWSINIKDIENEEDVLGILSMDSILEGEKKMRNEEPDHYQDILDEGWDADTADAWFQYVVMGEIIFG